MIRTFKSLAATVVTSATIVAMTAASASAMTHAATATPIQAVTQIANRPDSGVQGNSWALDTFTRTATITLVSEVAASNCPGSDTGHCYLWNGTISDAGTFTTIASQLAPRTGTLDQAITGKMTGGAPNVQFYSSWKTARASRVPTTENDNGQDPTGRHTTTNWVEQFFGASAVFNSTANPGGPDLGSKAGWTYLLKFGSNKECPNDAYRWVDSAADQWGSLNTDGNILTPTTADCT